MPSSLRSSCRTLDAVGQFSDQLGKPSPSMSWSAFHGLLHVMAPVFAFVVQPDARVGYDAGLAPALAHAADLPANAEPGQLSFVSGSGSQLSPMPSPSLSTLLLT